MLLHVEYIIHSSTRNGVPVFLDLDLVSIICTPSKQSHNFENLETSTFFFLLCISFLCIVIFWQKFVALNFAVQIIALGQHFI